MNLSDIIAFLALVVSVGAFFVNRAHAERLYKGSLLPAVTSHPLELNRVGADTKVTLKVVNYGPKPVLAVDFVALYSCGRKVEPWAQHQLDNLPVEEQCTYVLTETLQKDLQEAFGGLYEEGNDWHFRDKPMTFMVEIKFSYVPAVAELSRLGRTMHFRLSPQVSGKTISAWRADRVPKLVAWLSRAYGYVLQ